MTFILRTNEVFSTKDNVNNVIIPKKVPYLLERIQNVYLLPFIYSLLLRNPVDQFLLESVLPSGCLRVMRYSLCLSLSSLRACTLPARSFSSLRAFTLPARSYQSRRHHGAARMIPSPQPNLGGLENRNEIFHSIFGRGVVEH